MNLLLWLVLFCGLNGPALASVNPHLLDSSLGRVIDPSIQAYCEQKGSGIPAKTRVDAAALVKRGQRHDAILYLASERKLIIVKGWDSGTRGVFKAESSTAIAIPQASAGSTSFPASVLFFDSVGSEHFHVFEKNNLFRVKKVILTNSDKDLALEEIPMPDMDKMMLSSNEMKPYLETLRGKLYIDLLHHHFLAFDPTTKKNVFLCFNKKDGSFIQLYSFDSSEKDVVSLLPTSGTTNNFISFRETMLGVLIGFVSDINVLPKDPFVPKNGYFLLQEFIGCPASICYKDRFTEIMELKAKKKVYVNGWIYDWKGFGFAPDIASAQRSTSEYYIFDGPAYSLSTFMRKDGVTYLFNLNNRTQFTRIDPNGTRTVASKRSHAIGKVRNDDVMFYWPQTDDLFYFRKEADAHYGVRGRNLDHGHNVYRTIQHFFGFTIYDNNITVELYPLIDVYVEGPAVYIFVGNGFFTLDVDDFVEKRLRFVPKTVPKMQCIAVSFFGCKRIEPSPGIPDLVGLYPCAGLAKADPTLSSTKSSPESSTAVEPTASTFLNTDKQKDPGLSEMQIMLLVVIALTVLLLAAGLIFFFLHKKKKKKKEKKNRFGRGSNMLRANGSYMRSGVGSDVAGSTIASKEQRSLVLLNPVGSSTVSGVGDKRSMVPSNTVGSSAVSGVGDKRSMVPSKVLKSRVGLKSKAGSKFKSG